MHNLNASGLKHHAAIGGVAVNWAHLEHQVQSILWRLTGLNSRVGLCITQHMPFRSLCDAIVTVAHESPNYSHLAGDFEKFFKECDQLRVKRNDAVHALWGIFLPNPTEPPVTLNADLGEVTGMVIKARGRLNIKINKTTVHAMDDISEEIIGFSTRLGEFVEKNLPKLET